MAQNIEKLIAETFLEKGPDERTDDDAAGIDNRSEHKYTTDFRKGRN